MDINELFETDKKRHKLACEGKLERLYKTYDGSYPDLPNMNSTQMWDFFMNNSMVHYDSLARHRIKTSARFVDPNKRIVDFGVGYGWIIPVLLERNKRLDYTGIDFSVTSIEKLRSRYPDLVFLQSDISVLASEDFDYCLALEVLEHIVPKETFTILGKFYRLLRDGGHLVLSVPACEDLRKTCHPCSECGALQNHVGHVRSYTVELLSAELVLAGFQVMRTKVTDPYYGVPRKIIKLAKYLLKEEIPRSNIIVDAVKVRKDVKHGHI